MWESGQKGASTSYGNVRKEEESRAPQGATHTPCFRSAATRHTCLRARSSIVPSVQPQSPLEHTVHGRPRTSAHQWNTQPLNSKVTRRCGEDGGVEEQLPTALDRDLSLATARARPLQLGNDVRQQREKYGRESGFRHGFAKDVEVTLKRPSTTF